MAVNYRQIKAIEADSKNDLNTKYPYAYVGLTKLQLCCIII